MRNSILTGLTVLLLAACAQEGVGDDKSEALDDGSVEVAQLGSADSANPVFRGPIDLDETVADALTRRVPMHVWTFVAESTTPVFFDLASREGGDTVLYLYAHTRGGYSYLDGNDDCYSGTLNSCLRRELEAGEYAVVATSYQYAYRRRRGAFSYHLTAHCDSEDGCGTPEPQSCGSRGLPPCPDGQYCDWDNSGSVPACGAADHAGICQPIPDACPEYLHWVCGCDGETYENECFAAMSGIDVASDGECDPPGQGVGETCAGIAALQCEEGLVCDFSGNDSCHIADMGGVCRDPEDVLFCTMQYDPVCGCDGQTYGNDCMRRGAGVPFDHDGPCERPGAGVGEMCGGIAGFQCAEGLECDYSANDSCHISDMAGVCRDPDEAIFCTMQYDPVCGCDGHTYGNDCTRRSAGVPLDHEGACDEL